MKHEVERGQRSTMGEEARRRRRDSRHSGWRIVLLGKPMGAAAPDPGIQSVTPPTLLARLAVIWPRRLHRHVQERWSYAPSEVLFRLLPLIVFLVVVTLIGGVAALAALATRNSALDGFTVGVVLACLLLALASAYLGWGAFIDWLSRRRHGR
jgi:hypothetical protein